MNWNSSRFLFAAMLAGAAMFILWTGQALPPVVASHFGASGLADGFMSRTAYLLLMVTVTIGIPLAIVLVQALVDHTHESLRIPHRQYWMAPERRDATMAFMRRQAMRFAILLAVFLCFVHWLVVDGNAAKPPRLNNSLFIPALVAFFAAVGIWVAAFWVRFRRSA